MKAWNRMGQDSIILGDCIDVLGELRSEGGKVQLTVTSPPYFNARDYSKWSTYEEYMEWMVSVFKMVYDVTDEGRMCCINVSPVIQPRPGRNGESVRLPIPFDTVGIMCGMGWKFIEDIIWVKPEGSVPNRNGGFFRHRKPMAYKPNSVTEYILVFQKPMHGLIDSILRKTPSDIMERSLVRGDYERTNVWMINPETHSEHPAPFPIGVPERLIMYYSFAGDTVLDPMAGSGTTCLAAKNLDRHYIGIEKSNEYIQIAIKRLENH